MRNYWLFTPWYVKDDDLKRLARDHPIANHERLFQAGFGPHLDPKSFPVVDLRLQLEDFDNDCFTVESHMFVSERLRRAMNLEPSSVQYFEVDSTHSAAKARAMNYQVMNVLAMEEAADLAKSKYFQFPPISPGMGPARSPQQIHIREDLATPHELFVDSVFHRSVCTDALAVRVLRAGCTGVRFVDPQYLVGNQMRWRTLRGIEGKQWDAGRDDFVTQVIEAIQ